MFHRVRVRPPYRLPHCNPDRVTLEAEVSDTDLGGHGGAGSPADCHRSWRSVEPGREALQVNGNRELEPVEYLREHEWGRNALRCALYGGARCIARLKRDGVGGAGGQKVNGGAPRSTHHRV